MYNKLLSFVLCAALEKHFTEEYTSAVLQSSPCRNFEHPLKGPIRKSLFGIGPVWHIIIDETKPAFAKLGLVIFS